MHPVFETDFKNIVAATESRLRKFEGSSVLITGSCGFIGSYLVDLLAWCNENLFSWPCHIIGIDNHVVGDACRLKHLERDMNVRLFPWNVAWKSEAKPDIPPHAWIIHCAGIASPVAYRKKPLETLEVNVVGTWNMLEWARRWKASGFLQMSSSEVYGEPDVIPTPETYVGRIPTLGPRSSYDIGKVAGETICYHYQQEHGVNVMIARPFNIYGPGAVNDGRIIPELMSCIIEDREFVVHGDGSASRSYCYISDAVIQLLAVLVDGKPGEAYNIGNDSIDAERSISSVVETARTLFGKPRTKYITDAIFTKDAPTRRKPDVSKVKALRESTWPWDYVYLEQGLARTYMEKTGGSNAHI